MRKAMPAVVVLLTLLTLSFGASAAPKHAAAPAPAPAAAVATADSDTDGAAQPEAKEAKTDEPAVHGPVTMKVGVQVLELNKFDLAQATYTTELEVSFHCDREPCKPDPDVVNGKISGKLEKLHDEPLYKRFKFKAELAAVIDLKEYPFDNHVLPIVLEDKGDPEQVKYQVDEAACSFAPNIRLPGWEVGEGAVTVVEQDAGDGRKFSQLVFAIEAKRPAMMATFKSIVPVAIMLFVAAFTLLLKPKSASGRLATATGGLMSVVMFQVGQVGSLPPMGYLTRLDKFMIATYLVYLLNIFFSVAMVRLEEKKNERMSEFMYLAAAGAVPGLALVVWLGVFLKLV